MNIKEHIEAGHYPKDAKGRALVQTRGGRTLTVYATDHDADWPISCKMGVDVSVWRADGQFYGTHTGDRDILPPPPRKVKVTRWIILDAEENGEKSVGTWKTREGAIAWLDALGYPWANTYELVELSGDYEAVWS